MTVRSAVVAGTPRLAFSFAGEGELVVMLHGVGGNRRNWLSQIEALSPACLAVAWDARGYGDSDDYAGELSFGDVADDLLRLLDHFDRRRAHLVGLSMGGNIAMEFALRHPDRVASLVLADTDRGMQHIPASEREAFLALRREPILAGVALDELAVPIVASLLGEGAVPTARAEMIDSISRLHRDSYLKALKATVDFDVVGKLDRIGVPTLVIVGEEDRLTPVEEARAICAEIAGSELAVIPGAGHVSNVEQPERFSQALLRFLRSVGAAPS
ncbi:MULTISPECIES: alpha/beta fold hydrolase [Sphingomonadales]|uniref:Alpha/beta hydrolase fold n=1 Tax=Rhizorhabdus wittichii (strain DSM 6014 / CCUG 31198 / JCM 15750 / NBRC 105917 / EY 4224 / RW1) TaxID=392499 RepID=A0A9J9HF43_RHIWR|nr:alpha/beta hydrolase fold [Rhizorhabdus wittichii RW1]